ncbi:hypothetical protein SAMN04488543_1013 [Friedmanniella luteola]|uniref:DUF2087 domain-containing protein n=1 Tax=Friedmanniella luteola TaxID=546871 RepID=A0A1H1P7N4_9ACTN|nr:DUF2087 domain-containing protein [Friedmanniella luteola]SDS07286.1 hypothetical protein SAMN04488543_1013 [Friedmanniella luteola]
MTDDDAAPSATLLSRAAQQLAVLADRQRAALLGGVLRLEEPTQGCTVPALAADQGTDLRTTARHLAALEAAGLVTVAAHRVRPRVQVLEETAGALLAALPVTALLAADPALGRLFRHGRLTGLPVLARVDERERLAALLVQLLPADRALTEGEVNAALAEVTDDVASVRRFLVEENRLTRSAGRDYRRVTP